MGQTHEYPGDMLFKFRLVKQDALLSLTKLLNWCLGRSLLYFSEDSLDPNLCGIKTNRVNIFLAVYIPDLNISKHVKLTFLNHSLQGPCRPRLPKNPAELAPGGPHPRGQAKRGAAGQEQTVLQLCRWAAQRRPCRSRCATCWFLQTGREGRSGRAAGSLSLKICHFPVTCSQRSAKHLPGRPAFPSTSSSHPSHSACFLTLASCICKSRWFLSRTQQTGPADCFSPSPGFFFLTFYFILEYI